MVSIAYLHNDTTSYFCSQLFINRFSPVMIFQTLPCVISVEIISKITVATDTFYILNISLNFFTNCSFLTEFGAFLSLLCLLLCIAQNSILHLHIESILTLSPTVSWNKVENRKKKTTFSMTLEIITHSICLLVKIK